MTNQQLVEELTALAEKVANGGPHEWGYRDPVEGGFISDDWPFKVADLLPAIFAALTARSDGEHPLAKMVRLDEEIGLYDPPETTP